MGRQRVRPYASRHAVATFLRRQRSRRRRRRRGPGVGRRRRGRGRARGAARPPGRGLLRRRQHRHAGRVDLPPGPRPLRPRLLHRARHRPLRLAAGQVPAARQGGHGQRARGARDRAVLRRRAHRRRADDDRRGGLRRGDGRQDLAGHPGAGADAPRRRAAGLAGHGDPGRGRLGDRPAAGPDRGAGHRRGDRGRRLHRPAGRRDPARRGQGAGGHARWPSGRGWTSAPARRTPTPPTTSRCCPWSVTRAPSTRTAGCAPTPGSTAGGCATTGPGARR